MRKLIGKCVIPAKAGIQKRTGFRLVCPRGYPPERRRISLIHHFLDDYVLVEAERFLMSLSRDRFDYTEWRRHGLPHPGIEELARQTNICAKENL